MCGYCVIIIITSWIQYSTRRHSWPVAGFCKVIVYTTSCDFVRSHASSFTSPFFFILFSICFFHVCVDLPLLLLTSNFKAFIITFSFPFLKTWPYHHILLAQAILSKDSFMPNMSINSLLFLQFILIVSHHSPLKSLLFLFFLKLPSLFLSRTMLHFHTAYWQLILCNFCKPLLSSLMKGSVCCTGLVSNIKSLLHWPVVSFCNSIHYLSSWHHCPNPNSDQKILEKIILQYCSLALHLPSLSSMNRYPNPRIGRLVC